MTRECLMLALLAGCVGTIADAAEPKVSGSDSLAVVLKRTAEHIYDMANKNHDQGLDQLEMSDAGKRMKKSFSLLSQDNKLAGPRVPLQINEPTPTDPTSVTKSEFVQYFQAQAAKFDADLRASRVAQKQPIMPNAGFTQVATTHASPSRRDATSDKSDKSDKKDRDFDKDDNKGSASTQQASYQQQPVQPMPTMQQSGYQPHHYNQMAYSHFGYNPYLAGYNPYLTIPAGWNAGGHGHGSFGGGGFMGGGFDGGGFGGGGGGGGFEKGEKGEREGKHHK